jgi:hypothetical protein
MTANLWTKWHSETAANAMTSILAIVPKPSVPLPVAGCISQPTWLRFQRLYTLQFIQDFEEASRDTLNSSQLILVH